MSESTPVPSRIPLSVPVIQGNEWRYVKDCLDTGWVSAAGAYVTRFEDAVRDIVGTPHVIACQSGTAALHVSLQLAGVGAGDAVICPTLTFIATVNAITYTGARPVFVDCDEYMNISPQAVGEYLRSECDRSSDGSLTDRVTGLRVRAMVPVHIFGNPCDMVALESLASEFGLTLVEDAAESLGSGWADGPLAGRHTGTVGLLGAFSFNGNKVVTCGGGGCIVTSDDALAAHARHLTTTAKIDAVRFVHDEVGYNYRMTNTAAALGLAQLEQLGAFIEVKRANEERYRAGLEGLPGVTVIGHPGGTVVNHWFYSVSVEPSVAGVTRDQVMEALAHRNIETRPVWTLSHRQAPYAGDRVVSSSRAEWFADRILNVPCSSDLTPDQVDRVSEAISDTVRKGARR